MSWKRLKMKLGTRKIQQTKFTHTIALHPAWIRDRKLSKGCKLEQETTAEGDLILRPMKKEKR